MIKRTVLHCGGALLGLILLSLGPACTGSNGDGDGDGDGASGDGDAAGDGDLLGDGDFLGDGDTSGDGDVMGDGDVSGDGDVTGDGDLVGDGDVSGTGGTVGDGDIGDGDGPNPGCVIDLNCDPTPLAPTGDFGQDCVDRINQFRVGCHCLPPLVRWTEAEACADANAEYDQSTGEPHSGWRAAACEDESGPLSTQYYGWATNECPGYDSVESVIGGCLASMYSEGADWAGSLGRVPTQSDYESCEGSCYGQYGHFIAMTKESHTKVACGITESGEIWSVQNFE